MRTAGKKKKKKKQLPEKLVVTHFKNLNQICTHQCTNCVWIVLRWFICENTSSLLTLHGWLPHRSGCHPDYDDSHWLKSETCIVLIFLVKILCINQLEQERQKDPQVHRSIPHCQKQLCPPWVDPGTIKAEPFPPEMLQHFFWTEFAS